MRRAADRAGRWAGLSPRAPRRPLALGLVLSLGVTLAGCVGFATYPPVEGSIAVRDPNSPAMEEVMRAALVWTVASFPPEYGSSAASGGAYAVNLPEGVRRRVYLNTVGELGDRARPMTPENELLPTYHIKRIRISENRAEVDVLRPVAEMGESPLGERLSQQITVYLEGGWNPWRVVRHRAWAIGAFTAPPAYYMPIDDRTPPLPEPRPRD